MITSQKLHIRTHMCAHTHTHIQYTHTHNTHTHMHAHVRTHTERNTHNTHTHTHKYTHTQTHTHTRTHTHNTHIFYPLSYFSFQPLLHDWCTKAVAHIKEPLLLISKNSAYRCGSRFPLSLSEWSFTICAAPYNNK